MAINIKIDSIATIDDGQTGAEVSTNIYQNFEKIIKAVDGVGNAKLEADHYEPSYGTACTTTQGSVVSVGGNVVTGVLKDSKGHITGVTVGAIPSSMPANGGTADEATFTPYVRIGTGVENKQHYIWFNDDNSSNITVGTNSQPSTDGNLAWNPSTRTLNLGSGTISLFNYSGDSATVGGKSASDFSEKVSVVLVPVGTGAHTINPNTYYNLGSVAAVNLKLGTPKTNIYNEYMFKFVPTTANITVSIKTVDGASVKWVGEPITTFDTTKTYLASIVDNILIMVGA